MVTVVVLANPPREGLVLAELADDTALSAADATDLYAALLCDTVVAAEDGGGDLLVNYRPDDLLPAEHRREVDAESAVRATVDRALADPGAVRFEEQVGSTPSTRVGNTVTHLLEEEGASGVIVVDPTAAMLGRTGVDELSMKLRRSEVAVAPSTRGRVAAMGFGGTLDFEDVLAPPTVVTLTERARAADLDVDFGPVEPIVETGADLATLVALVGARARAGRNHPEFTAAAVEERDLTLATMDGGVAVLPSTDRS